MRDVVTAAHTELLVPEAYAEKCMLTIPLNNC